MWKRRWPLPNEYVPPNKPIVHGPNLTNLKTPTWSWNSGGGGVGSYRTKLDAEDFSSSIETKDTTFIPATDLTEGSHTIFVQERDAAGNWSGTGRFTIRIDFTPPNKPVIGYSKTVTNNTKPTWIWTSGGSGIGVFRYKQDDGNMESGSIEISQFNFTPLKDLSEGNHVLYVQEKDSASNWSQVVALPFKIDLTPPLSPAIDSTPYSPLNSLRPKWTWKTGGSGQGIYRCRIDNSNLASGADTISQNQYSPSVDLSESRHTLYVQESDSAGNWSATSSRSIVLAIRGFVGGNISSSSAQSLALGIRPNGDPIVNLFDGGHCLVKQLSGTNWIQLGLLTDLNCTGWLNAFTLDQNGIPNIIVVDSVNRGSVKKFSGGEWVTIGNQFFSKGEIGEPAIAISQTGIVYTAFRDGANGDKTTVMKLNGNIWDTVGNAGFSNGFPIYFALKISKSGVPYVVYIDNYYSPERTIVKKYNSSSAKWETLGNLEFHSFQNGPSSLFITSSDSVYLAIKTFESNGEGLVYKYDGIDWVQVGPTVFKLGEGESYYLSIGVDSYGNKFSGYRDLEGGIKIGVKELKNNLWVKIPNAPSSTKYTRIEQIVLNPDGVPYVLYTDPITNTDLNGPVKLLKMSFDP